MEQNRLNPFVHLVKDQQFMLIDRFQLEIGDTLTQVPVAYKTWGQLNAEGTNCMVICHALSGSADVSDWWGALLGEGKAFDTSRYYVVCINSLGSPYGTASPCTINPRTGKVYGPEFPLATIKDDARLQRLVLQRLGVTQVAVVVGGSMGGMTALEYLYFGPEFVRSAIVLAACAYHSAWAISWGEAQRQSIYADAKYRGGYYSFEDPPKTGLSAARMAALLTYRSRNSFDAKFGRAEPNPLVHRSSDVPDESTVDETRDRYSVHNHGNKLSKEPVSYRPKAAQNYFTAQSYLRYQGERFVERFDANCYITITRKLDTHDVARGRGPTIEAALGMIKQPVLVIGVPSDGLFTFSEQELLKQYIPNSKLRKITSPEGHDAFLLEFREINDMVLNFCVENLSDISSDVHRQPIERPESNGDNEDKKPLTAW